MRRTQNALLENRKGAIVRELLLGRRRSRVPWVYMVYNRHARNKVRAVFAKRHHSRSQQEHGGNISAM